MDKSIKILVLIRSSSHQSHPMNEFKVIKKMSTICIQARDTQKLCENYRMPLDLGIVPKETLKFLKKKKKFEN